MKFLYKIHSELTASRRANSRPPAAGSILRLGWKRYIDVVELGLEVWVFFHGPHQFENGVYIKGIVKDIDVEQRAVFIRVREYNTDSRSLTEQPQEG